MVNNLYKSKFGRLFASRNNSHSRSIMQFSALCNSARGFSPPIFGSFGANNYFGENVKCANFVMPRTPNYDIYIKWTWSRSSAQPKTIMSHRFVTKQNSEHTWIIIYDRMAMDWVATSTSPTFIAFSTFIQECFCALFYIQHGSFQIRCDERKWHLCEYFLLAIPLMLIPGGFGAQVQRPNRIYEISRLIMGQNVW